MPKHDPALCKEGSKTMPEYSIEQTTQYLGIDVAKNELVLSDSEGAFQLSCANHLVGFEQLAREVNGRWQQVCFVIEASGGYQNEVVRFLQQSGLDVCIINPRQIRDYAKSLGWLAWPRR